MVIHNTGENARTKILNNVLTAHEKMSWNIKNVGAYIKLTKFALQIAEQFGKDVVNFAPEENDSGKREEAK